MSATFTGHVIGTATIHAVSAALTPTDSGLITVTAGSGTQVRVETLANGSGMVVPAQSVGAAADHRLRHQPRRLEQLRGQRGGDLVARDHHRRRRRRRPRRPSTATTRARPSPATSSARPRSARSTATFTGDSGTITVTAGTATQVRVETLANGTGMVVPAQNVGALSSITVFAISRDASDNFIANVAATWSLTGATGGVVAGDLVAAGDNKSAVFTGHLVGSAKVTAVDGTFTGDSGILTVIPGGARHWW